MTPGAFRGSLRAIVAREVGRLQGAGVSGRELVRAVRELTEAVRTLSESLSESLSEREANAPANGERTLERTTSERPAKGEGDYRGRGKPRSASSTKLEDGYGYLDQEALESFLEFWSSYPNKKSRKPAAKAWANLSERERELAANDMRKDRANRDSEWAKDGGRFIPHASSYLNQRRWEDDWTPTRDPFATCSECGKGACDGAEGGKCEWT